MPTLSQVQIPLPTDPDEFEDIVASAIAACNPSSPPQRIGRRGQRQNGVDIYYEDESTRRTGVQCKLVSVFSIDQVKAEVTKAEGFAPSIESFVMALGLPRDAKLQKLLYQLSIDRGAKKKFRVGVWFWDDISFMLSRDPDALARHYPQLFGRISGPSVVDPVRSDQLKRRLAAYEELWAYRRSCLPVKRHPEMGWDEALEDIAWDFDKHAKALEDMARRLGPVLPQSAGDALIKAANIAQDGTLEISLEKIPEVSGEACKAAEEMYDALGTAVGESRRSLERDGVRFD